MYEREDMEFIGLPDDMRLKIYDAIYDDDESFADKIDMVYDSFLVIANALGLSGYTGDEDEEDEEDKEEEDDKEEEMFALDYDIEGLIVYGKKLDGEIGSEHIDPNATFPSSVIMEVEGQLGIQVVEAPDSDLQGFDSGDIVGHQAVVSTLQRLESGLLFIPVSLV